MSDETHNNGEEIRKKPNLSLKKILDNVPKDDHGRNVGSFMFRRLRVLEYTYDEMTKFFGQDTLKLHKLLAEQIESLPELIQSTPQAPILNDEMVMSMDPMNGLILNVKTPGKHLRQHRRIIAPFSNCPWVKDNTQRLWWYIDEASIIQGPFTSLEMDNWFHEGYFFNELLLSYDSKTNFMRLIEFLHKFYGPNMTRPTPNLNKSNTMMSPAPQTEHLLYTPQEPKRNLPQVPNRNDILASVLADLRFGSGRTNATPAEPEQPKTNPSSNQKALHTEEDDSHNNSKDEIINAQANMILREDDDHHHHKPLHPAITTAEKKDPNKAKLFVSFADNVRPHFTSSKTGGDHSDHKDQHHTAEKGQAHETSSKQQESGAKSDTKTEINRAAPPQTTTQQAPTAAPTETKKEDKKEDKREEAKPAASKEPPQSNPNKPKTSGQNSPMTQKGKAAPQVVWVAKADGEKKSPVEEEKTTFGYAEEDDYDKDGKAKGTQQQQQGKAKKGSAPNRRTNFRIEYEPKKA